MKIPFICSTCQIEAVQAGHTPAPHLLHVNPSDTGAYELHCPQGHVTHAVLEQMRFELLFEVGAHAIQAGYFREAVSSFASSLERFLELYIKIACRSENLSSPTISAAWKGVNSQSERQLGAYFFLHAIREKSVAPYLSNDMTALRNSVIHKGKLASRSDAVAFGNAVLVIINPLFRVLKQRDKELLQQMVDEHMRQAIDGSAGAVSSSVFFPTILNASTAPALPDITDVGSWICTDPWQG
jgi:hypothetical protein